jgi:MFS family permease
MAAILDRALPTGLPLVRSSGFRLYLLARTCSEFSLQMGAVAIGWHVYSLTGRALDLGLIGLAQFIPSALFAFVAGHAADRFDRRRVALMCQTVQGMTALFLVWGSASGWLDALDIFAAAAVLGAATSFEGPATAALLPAVTPDGMLQKSTALSTSAFQVAIIAGPALSGLLCSLSPAAAYAAMAGLWFVAGILACAIRLEKAPRADEPPSLKGVFAGVEFTRRNPTLLGITSLDLFAVLLGGVTALTPIYASDVLHVGPLGLGTLRGAPAVGALLVTGILARNPIDRKAGLRMFQAVIVFGVATVVFALSQWLWLSLLALSILGAADTVSMVIRGSLVQLATPDSMRGRVGAVNFLFINTSAQLGEFESGVTAALFGTVPAAVFGGLGTVAVALLWMRWFPTLRRMERLE